jgi:hypothetical protein
MTNAYSSQKDLIDVLLNWPVIDVIKRRADRDFENQVDETVVIGNRLNSIHLECQNQVTQVYQLYQRKIKLDAHLNAVIYP